MSAGTEGGTPAWHRRAARTLGGAAVLALAACARAGPETGSAASRAPRVVPAPGGDSVRPPASGPLTRAERSGYRQTSSHADVLAFLDSLEAALRAGGTPLVRGAIGRTTEEREIPYVVASRPLVRTPAEARALRRPIVYVQGNIHGGEVEGKEALQMLLRDLLLDPRPNVLDSIVLVAVPIYNADGNERWGPQERQRGAQNGPPEVGQRPNAQELDLNRDYVKAEAPETRASLAMFGAWDPHVFVDLHTTNGSYHGYALTYAPSLHPAAPLGEYTRRVLLPDVRRRVAERHGYPTYDYGNFEDGPSRVPLDSLRKNGWWTYDHRPRFGTNYYGLRGRVAVLSEAYSHDPFPRRVASTYAFVRELLGYVAEQSDALLRMMPAQPGGERARNVPVRAALPDSAPGDWIVVEALAATGDTTRTEPGGPRGYRRTGRYQAQWMPAATYFVPTRTADVPAAFVLSPRDTAAVRVLRLHGIQVGRLQRPWTGDVHAFVVDSAVRAVRPFQGHRELVMDGTRWVRARQQLPAGSFVVAGGQPLGRLALVLLHPLSDDGLATWGHFGDRIAPGVEFPVLEARGAVPGPVQAVE